MTDATPAHDVREGKGRTLLFLHGIGGNQASFRPQLDALGGAYRAAAWTMPGYDGSPPLPEMTFAGLAGAAVGLLDHLNCPRAVLVGHSLGGMIAQEIVARHPTRVDALVLACTSPAFGGSDGDFQRKFLASRLKPIDEGKTPADIAPDVVGGLLASDAPPGARDAAIASMSRISPEAYRAALTCLVGFDRRGDLAAIRCPTLLIAGGEDRTAPPEVMERMAEKIPGARYVCIEGAGHLANLERPAAFNAALGDFLGSLENGGCNHA